MNNKQVRYAFILAYSKEYPISTLAEITKVSRSGYYKWLKRDGESSLDKKDEEMIPFILKIFNDHKELMEESESSLRLKMNIR